MKFKKIALVFLVLPLTVFLDLILYGLMKTCPTCGSFTRFLTTEGAISFPIVASLLEESNRFLKGIN